MRKLLLCGIIGILVIIVLILGFIVLSGGHKHAEEPTSSKEQVKKQKYYCPMHPTIISDRPGDCPICNMRLIPMEEESQEAQFSQDGEYIPVKISPEKQQLIGVKKDKVLMRSLGKTVRAVGTIGYNERKLYNFNTKFTGWIEEADCCALAGKFIEKGTRLFSIYSPELVSAQQEYLVALETKKKMEESSFPESNLGNMIESYEKLVNATKQKLLFWGITEEQIDELANRGEPSKVMWLSAPASGFIIDDDLTNGKYVNPGETVFKIVDLSTVWVNAEIYEYEIPYIKTGDQAEIKLSYYPGETFSCKITYIYPYVNSTTRTVKLRIELPNPDYKLKIDMYANVNLKIDWGKKLALPIEAVMDSGKRQIVFVDKGDGLFEPREVKLGAKTDDYYEVISGLSEGNVIVSSANFLIDAESKIKAALQGMGSESKSHEGHK